MKKNLTKINEWFNSHHKKEHRPVIIVSLIVISILLLLIVIKLFPYMILFLFALIYLRYDINEHRKEKVLQESYETRLIENHLYEVYYGLAEYFIVVLKEFSRELGIKVTSISSIMCNKFCSKKSDIWFFRFRLQMLSEPEFDLEELRFLIQERLNQLAYDTPIWLVGILRKEKHIELLATYCDCYEVEEFRMNYESKKSMMFQRDNPVPTDDDEF